MDCSNYGRIKTSPKVQRTRRPASAYSSQAAPSVGIPSKERICKQLLKRQAFAALWPQHHHHDHYHHNGIAHSYLFNSLSRLLTRKMPQTTNRVIYDSGCWVQGCDSKSETDAVLSAILTDIQVETVLFKAHMLRNVRTPNSNIEIKLYGHQRQTISDLYHMYNDFPILDKLDIILGQLRHTLIRYNPTPNLSH
ncbi:hypothetical protein V9T40_005328 [Parthenolecanium corni]|uniref:Uncharacterized protein n=1 Tax=Parthenolecanium corni TaxID=536013 RepID=A0AAN9Y377_9HEMI